MDDDPPEDIERVIDLVELRAAFESEHQDEHDPRQVEGVPFFGGSCLVFSLGLLL